MALKAIVTDAATLTDKTREFYKKRDNGTYILDVEQVQGHALEDVVGLKQTLSETKEKFRKAREQLDAFGEMTADAAKEAVEKVTSMAHWTPEDKVKQQIEAREKQLVERHRKEIDKRDFKSDKLTKALERSLVLTAAQQSIIRHKGIPELLLPVVENHVKMIEGSDGEFRAQVMGEDGETPRISEKSGSTDPMSIDEFVETLKGDPSYGRAFEGSGATGSGAFGSSATAAGKKGAGKIQVQDQDALNRSIEDIASGKVVVTDF